jgi:type III pantothenate kinase
MLRIVADLGNSRLKWGRIGGDGRLEQAIALPLDDLGAWDAAWQHWHPVGTAPGAWTIASVNPPVAERLDAFLKARGVTSTKWYRSAVEVPIRHDVDSAAVGGADRALAVAGALGMHPGGGPGLIVSCGTAITVERVAADGTWQGGAIAPGLALSARALHMMTAQLPLVSPAAAPPPWGRDTRQALDAGLYWGTVGCVRELLMRQAAGLTPDPWLMWTGGDAALLAPAIEWTDARVVPYLVLEGLAWTVRLLGVHDP